MSHHCHARGCKTSCAPERLMCPRHWRMVPRNLQRAVWATYRPGQCDDKDPSEQWFAAADAAIDFVYTLEAEMDVRRTFGACGCDYDGPSIACSAEGLWHI